MLVLAILLFCLFVFCGWAAVKPAPALSLVGVDLCSMSKRERVSLLSSLPLFLGAAAVAFALSAAYCMHLREIARAEAPAVEAREAARQQKARKYGVGSSYMADSTTRRSVEK